MDFALNQKTTPKLGFAAFLDLAAKLGCVGIEPRNDLGRPFFDGVEPARAGAMARDRKSFTSILQRYFNIIWDTAACDLLFETKGGIGRRRPLAKLVNR
jgi:2-keto-myo-inositol isomerase